MKKREERSRSPWFDRSGYLSATVRFTDGSKTTVQQHREVMEAKLGRKLGPSEVVHHRDGNKKNNDLSNLEVQGRAEHSQQHAEGVRRPWKHGSKSGYWYHKCRCDLCRAANTATHRKWRGA